MKNVFRVLIVWLVLLALPFQGLATAAMLPCAGCEHTQVCDHDAGKMEQASAHHATPDKAAMHGSAGDHHAKCSNCAGSCVTSAIAAPGNAAVVVHAPAAMSIPFNARHVPSVYPDYPERPPRFARA